ncbi:hypothetical protein NM213_04925 [Pseudomonas lactis]|uniref:hypothetical protein n=1 Tax=Pseudomonas lactis TaxID=1615674 RepID=UPI001F437E82|nr:hypothetical protein [Pseudomonas lactis]MDR8369255.1 hypothetical protein [Pseudomonas lactis]
MFNRNDFDAYLRIAQNHLDMADTDPIQLRNALIMMMNAMRKLADSAEHDLKEQLTDASKALKEGGEM